MIGIIDSGTGGMNVIAECLKYYNEDFVYILDNKNCPYGNKKIKDLKLILIRHINNLINNYDVDLIVIACNTLSALLDHSLMLEYKIPILKTVPKIKNIKNDGKNILVFATKNTIKNSKELKLIKLNYPLVKTLTIKGLPKLIDNYLCEKDIKNNYEINKLLKYYFLNKIKFKINNKIDTNIYLNKRTKAVAKQKINIKLAKGELNIKLKNNISTYNMSNKYCKAEYISLGCTHFKHIKNKLQYLFNNQIKFFACEEDVAKNSKWLVRKHKKISTLNLILTKLDPELEKVVYEMFDRANKRL